MFGFVVKCGNFEMTSERGTVRMALRNKKIPVGIRA